MHLCGQQVSTRPWYNLSLQALQPRLLAVLREPRAADAGCELEAELQAGLAFHRGSSLRLSGALPPGGRAGMRLLEAAVQLPSAGLWVRLASTHDGAVGQRLLLRLEPAGGGAGQAACSIELMLGDDRAQEHAASSGAGGGFAAAVAPARSRLVPASSTAQPDAGAVQWAVCTFLVGPDILAAAAAQAGHPLQLAAVDLLLLGRSRAEADSTGFRVHLGEPGLPCRAALPRCMLALSAALPRCMLAPSAALPRCMLGEAADARAPLGGMQASCASRQRPPMAASLLLQRACCSSAACSRM